jgi:hypothetical protein
MDRTVKWLKIGLSALFILVPIACVPLFTTLAPYGRPFTSIPSFSSFLSRPSARAQLGTALLERSAVRKAAISAKDSLMYYGFGYIDTPRIVSGKDGWLFLKDEFWEGRCLDRSYFEKDLAYADALQDVAEAAGLRLIFAVAPDKATIYPGELQPAARAYWACKTENAATWREIAEKTAPRIIDHIIPVLEEKRRAPAEPIFFATDTHWTPLAAALARRQLAAVLVGGTGGDFPAPHVTGQKLSRKTDLRNAMLIVDGEDSFSLIDATIEAAFAAAFVAEADLGVTSVIHDSFYGTYKPSFQAMFPTAPFLLFNGYAILDGDAQANEAILSKSQTIVVETVERALFTRLDGVLSWTGSVGASILQRAQRKAKECDAFVAIEPAEAGSSDSPGRQRAPTVTPIAASDTEGYSTLPVPAAPVGTLPCLSLALNRGQADPVEIFLPKKDSPAGASEFEEGRSIRIPVSAGTSEVRMVLPRYVAGQEVRVRAGAHGWPAGLNALQVGVLRAEKGR